MWQNSCIVDRRMAICVVLFTMFSTETSNSLYLLADQCMTGDFRGMAYRWHPPAIIARMLFVLVWQFKVRERERVYSRTTGFQVSWNISSGFVDL